MRTLADIEAEKKQLEHKVQALYRAIERKDFFYEGARPLCADHRDKQKGKPCLACTMETVVRQRNELLRGLEKFRETLDGEIWQTYERIQKEIANAREL